MAWSYTRCFEFGRFQRQKRSLRLSDSAECLESCSMIFLNLFALFVLFVHSVSLTNKEGCRVAAAIEDSERARASMSMWAVSQKS